MSREYSRASLGSKSRDRAKLLLSMKVPHCQFIDNYKISYKFAWLVGMPYWRMQCSDVSLHIYIFSKKRNICKSFNLTKYLSFIQAELIHLRGASNSPPGARPGSTAHSPLGHEGIYSVTIIIKHIHTNLNEHKYTIKLQRKDIYSPWFRVYRFTAFTLDEREHRFPIKKIDGRSLGALEIVFLFREVVDIFNGYSLNEFKQICVWRGGGKVFPPRRGGAKVWNIHF